MGGWEAGRAEEAEERDLGPNRSIRLGPVSSRGLEPEAPLLPVPPLGNPRKFWTAAVLSKSTVFLLEIGLFRAILGLDLQSLGSGGGGQGNSVSGGGEHGRISKIDRGDYEI